MSQAGVRDAAESRPDARAVQQPAGLGERAWCTWLPLLVVLLGIALRVREYLYDRSLWPDEVTVASDALQRSYGQLMHVNPNGQAAPIGWFWATKASAQVFGPHELALRLLPFIASVVSMLLFPYVGRRLVGRWAMPAALLMFATAPHLIYYAAEAKQYSSDVAALLVAIAVTLVISDRRPSLRLASAWALMGAVLVWFSQPGILVVAACGLVLAARWVRRPGWSSAIVLAAGLPAAVLAIDYVLLLRQQSKSSLLQNYWVAGYPPKPLQVPSLARWLYHDVEDLLQDPGALHHPALALLLGAMGLGLLARRRRTDIRAVTLLMLPLVVAVTVAVVRLYPLRQRLALYLLPLVFLLICAGLSIMDRPAQRPWVRATQATFALAVAVAVGVTVYPAAARGVEVFGRPIDHTVGRQALDFIAARYQPGDQIYREYPWASVTYDYYAPLHPQLPEPGQFDFAASPAGGCDVTATLATHLQVGTRVWVYFDSRGSNEPANAEQIFLSYFRSVGKQLLGYHKTGADGGAYLFRISGHGPPSMPPWQPGTCFQFR